MTETSTDAVIRDVPNIITTKIKGLKRGKTPGEDGICSDLLMDAREIATLKLANYNN